MKNITLIVVLIVTLSIMMGCSKPSDAPKSFEQLKQEKSTGQYQSEYDKCVAEAKKNIEQHEKLVDDCINATLKTKGYDDGLNCIQVGIDVPPCTYNRYNAQVDADNACNGVFPVNISQVNVMDCISLLKNS